MQKHPSTDNIERIETGGQIDRHKAKSYIPQSCLSVRAYAGSEFVGLNIFDLYTLYIEQHIKTYNNIQYTNGIQKKVFRLI